MISAQQILFLLVVMIANIIQTVTGFAGTMLAMPASTRLIGLSQASAILNMMALLSSIWIVWYNINHIQWRELVKIVFLMGVGMLCGGWIADYVPEDILLTFYGVLILAIAVYKLSGKHFLKAPEGLLPVVLVSAGMIHRLFVSGGSFLVIYASVKLPQKDAFRATLSAVWVLLNGYLFSLHIRENMWNGHTIFLTLMCVPVLVLGIWIGGRVQKKLSQTLFLRMTYILLVISGILIIW